MVWSWWRRCWWFSKRLNDAWFSYLSGLHNGQKCYNIYLLVKFHYCITPLMMMFGKEDSPWFPSLLVTPRSLSEVLDKSLLLRFCSQKVKFTIHYTVHYSLFTVLFTIHYSLLLFIILFTPNFCLFKGNCPLSLTQNLFTRTCS